MKLNQATAAAAFLSVSTATLASSSAASSSSYDELKDKVAPLLASRPKHYLHRMLQELSDECKDTWFYSEIEKCPVSQTVVENTITVDYNACDASFREACTADNGAIVEETWGDIVGDCTYMDQSIKFILKESLVCVATPCVSEYESVMGQVRDELVKGAENFVREAVASTGTNMECKIDSSTATPSAGRARMLALAATSAAAALFIF